MDCKDRRVVERRKNKGTRRCGVPAIQSVYAVSSGDSERKRY
jgi:hypothetical protein